MNLQDKKETPDWRKQQDIIAKFLEDNSFEVWIERGIKNRRIDVLAKRSYKNKTYYIIFEVKHYNNVTAGVEDKFFEQLSDYVQLFILRELKRRSFEHVSKQYVFVGYLVLSKDYGIYKNRRKNWRENKSFSETKELEETWQKNVYLFSSTKNYIQSNLESIGLPFYSQSNMLHFLNKEE